MNRVDLSSENAALDNHGGCCRDLLHGRRGPAVTRLGERLHLGCLAANPLIDNSPELALGHALLVLARRVGLAVANGDDTVDKRGVEGDSFEQHVRARRNVGRTGFGRRRGGFAREDVLFQNSMEFLKKLEHWLNLQSARFRVFASKLGFFQEWILADQLGDG